MAAMVRMTALSVFANTQIVNRREGAPRADTVGIGDPFDAPWHIARDLARNGLAKADDPDELDEEPTEALAPHPSLSAPEHAIINARRAGKGAHIAARRADADAARQQAVTVALKARQDADADAARLRAEAGAEMARQDADKGRQDAEAAKLASAAGGATTLARNNVPPTPPASGAAG